MTTEQKVEVRKAMEILDGAQSLWRAAASLRVKAAIEDPALTDAVNNAMYDAIKKAEDHLMIALNQPDDISTGDIGIGKYA